MAIVRSVATGKSRGKAGSARFSVYRGRTVMAEQPVSVHNPRSQGQMAQRSKLAGISQILLGYNLLTRVGLNGYRALPRSRRGTVLTHRSAVAQQLMRELRDVAIPSDINPREAFLNVMAALSEKNARVRMSLARPLENPILVQLKSTTISPINPSAVFTLRNKSAKTVVIDNARAFWPFGQLEAGIIAVLGCVSSTPLVAPITLEPGGYTSVSMTFQLLEESGEVMLTPIMECYLNGVGIASSEFINFGEGVGGTSEGLMSKVCVVDREMSNIRTTGVDWPFHAVDVIENVQQPRENKRKVYTRETGVVEKNNNRIEPHVGESPVIVDDVIKSDTKKKGDVVVDVPKRKRGYVFSNVES